MTVITPNLATPVASQGLKDPENVRRALIAIKKELNEQFVERATAIDACVLAILAKQHGFLLGPPGTAKSMLIRELVSRFTGAAYFEALLTKHLPPEAVLGPWSIPGIKEGKMLREYQDFLPTANFAMLDEFGKMSDALGHSLLAISNERRLHQVENGKSWVDVPLYSFFGGSNELPTDESEAAAAMFDRVLIRATVDAIVEPSAFVAMLQGAVRPANPTTIEFTELQHVIDNVIGQITIPRDVYEAIITLRTQLEAEHIVNSPRRWKQSMTVLQASAFLAGRPSVTVEDMEALRYCLWELPIHIKRVERLTLSVSNPLADEAYGLMEKAQAIAAEVRNAHGLSNESKFKQGTASSAALRALKRESDDLRVRAEAAGAGTKKIDEVQDLISATSRVILTDFLGIDPQTLNVP